MHRISPERGSTIMWPKATVPAKTPAVDNTKHKTQRSVWMGSIATPTTNYQSKQEAGGLAAGARGAGGGITVEVCRLAPHVYECVCVCVCVCVCEDGRDGD